MPCWLLRWLTSLSSTNSTDLHHMGWGSTTSSPTNSCYDASNLSISAKFTVWLTVLIGRLLTYWKLFWPAEAECEPQCGVSTWKFIKIVYPLPGPTRWVNLSNSSECTAFALAHWIWVDAITWLLLYTFNFHYEKQRRCGVTDAQTRACSVNCRRGWKGPPLKY